MDAHLIQAIHCGGRWFAAVGDLWFPNKPFGTQAEALAHATLKAPQMR